MQKFHFLILSGDGINCERETAWAFDLAGAKSSIVHINDLLETPSILNNFDGMAIPGGFSFGDDLGSGQVMAYKIKYGLSEKFSKFVEDKKPIIGICNGFQILVKLGLLPNPKNERMIALAPNESGYFINCWVKLSISSNTVCKWTTLLNNQDFFLPIRHAEGRVVFTKGKEDEIYQKLKEKGQIPFYYYDNVNGSIFNIAGVCDEKGIILGMMPHPEGYLFEATNPVRQNDVFKKGKGQLIFDSIVQYLASS